MKRPAFLIAGILAALAGAMAFADNVTSTVDGGGQRATSANYTMDGSVGGIGDASAGGEVSLKPGYVGQLTDVTNVAITAAPSAVDEGDNVQLAGAATMDDASVTPLTGSEIAWPGPAYPVLAISPAGLAETMQVYAGVNASVTGLYLGVSGSGMFLVRDANPDNFGIYADDRVPDWWQVQWFGIRNYDGAAHANPDGDPYDNEQEWIALTDPTNPASYFEIVAISNRAPTNAVCCLSSSNRLYRLEWTTNLIAGGWTNMPGVTPVAGNGGLFWLNDTNAPSPRFYKVSVRVP